MTDIDDPAKIPPEWWEHLNTAPFQNTRPDDPRRGHYLFAQPPGRTIGAGKLPNGAGEYRGAGAVIMVANSHHKDGGRYTLVRTGPVPVMPDGIAARAGGTSADEFDSAPDAVVAEFIETHSGEGSHPKAGLAIVKILKNKLENLSRAATRPPSAQWSPPPAKPASDATPPRTPSPR